MAFTLTEEAELIRITFTGNVDALDLIMLTQSAAYKQALQGRVNPKVLQDFTRVTGAQFDAQDASGLALLGRRDIDNVPNLHLVIVPGHPGSRNLIELFAATFAGTSWKVEMAESVKAAEQRLRSG